MMNNWIIDFWWFEWSHVWQKGHSYLANKAINASEFIDGLLSIVIFASVTGRTFVSLQRKKIQSFGAFQNMKRKPLLTWSLITIIDKITMSRPRVNLSPEDLLSLCPAGYVNDKDRWLQLAWEKTNWEISHLFLLLSV